MDPYNHNREGSQMELTAPLPLPPTKTKMATTSSSDSLDLTEYGLDDSDAQLQEEEVREEPPEEPVDPRSLLTPEQVQQFREIFTVLDEQGHGRIHTKLLGMVFRSLGYNPTKAQIREYMAKADPEGKGLMDFQGFLLPLAENIDAVPETLEDILLAFKVLDESEQGFITTNQLYEYLTTLGEYLEDFEIDLLIKMADPRKEGKVVYEEFLEKMIGVPKKKKKGDKGKKDKKKK